MKGFAGMIYYSFLSVIFITTFLASVNRERKPLDRAVDLLVGIVTFAMFIMYNHLFGSTLG